MKIQVNVIIVKRHNKKKYFDAARENKGEWFGMMYLLGAIWRL